MHQPEPILHPVRLADLRPTQMTVGLREVARKRRQWRDRVLRDGPEFLGQHMIPAVRGPGGRLWMIDAHHLARALYDEGVEAVLVRIVADLDGLPGRLFRTYMDNRGWLHPFDAAGRRRAHKAIPKTIGDLTDDPYRSLAGELRRAGGYAKDATPYAEFLWADYLRRHVGAHLITDDFEQAVQQALTLANADGASYLPGWAGVHD